MPQKFSRLWRSPIALIALVALIALSVRAVNSDIVLAQTPTPTPEPTETPSPSPTVSPTITPTPTATPTPAPADIRFPEVQCVGFPSQSATAFFTWVPAQGAFSQWLDVSAIDGSFAPGTFGAAGPLSPDTAQVTWQGLQPGVTYFWRVNAATPIGWVTSATGVFVPCSHPNLRTVAWTCAGGGIANVVFRWAPASPWGATQWLDLSIFNNNFAPGTFLAAGPLSPFGHELVWPGILANVDHFWRINAPIFFGWNPSPTGHFRATC